MRLSRASFALYLSALALLPWSWFPPFPWLHEHAQWSDAVFAVAFALWLISLWLDKRRPPMGAPQVAIASYFFAALLSFVFAAPNLKAGLKLLGIAELCLLALVTSDLAARPGAMPAIARVVAVSALTVAAAAILGLALFYGGATTRLIGIYGELTPSSLYARAQAGLYNPNLLASFSIFALAVVSHREGKLHPLVRGASLAAILITALLTFSRGILGVLLAAVIARAHTRKRRIFAALFGALSAAIIIFLTVFRVSLDPTRPWAFEIVGAGDSSRYQALMKSAETVAESPLWGVGPGAHPAVYNNAPFDSHMTVLNIAATLGLPALAAFASLLTLLWCRRRRPTSLAIWGGLAGLALDALAQDIEDFRHLWVLLGIADADARTTQASS
jgi:hypothetical protein